MSDARLRDHTRAAAASGDPQAEAQALRDRVRSGEMTRGRLFLAAVFVC